MKTTRFWFFANARNAAFTLIEIIVALTVVLVLAAVAVPSLNGYLKQKNVETAATQLATVRDALYNTATGNNAYWQKITAGASRLSQLSTVIVSKSAASLNSCKAQYANADVNRWNSNGPFVNFPIDPNTGFVTTIGTAVDTITRNPFSATAGTVRINFLSGVDLDDATQLDVLVDNGDGNATGIVQWVTPAVNGLVTMYYFVAINNVC